MMDAPREIVGTRKARLRHSILRKYNLAGRGVGDKGNRNHRVKIRECFPKIDGIKNQWFLENTQRQRHPAPMGNCV